MQRGPVFAGYNRPGAPLRSYAVIIAVFNALFGALLWWARRSDRLPKRIKPAEVVLLGVATHSASRLLAKDKVTSVLRAPFSEFQEMGYGPEINESSRGTGLRLAIGELVT